MNRRQFSTNVAATLIAGAIGGKTASRVPPESAAESGTPLFQLSVMLWTVFRDLPFEQRLEKVSQAGYNNVELVGEYEHWSESDFLRANAKRRELGICFDATSGLKHGLANPADREALLGEVRTALTAMEKLDCANLIVLTGNAVPGLPRDAQHQSCIDGLRGAAEIINEKTIGGQSVRLLLESIDLVENPRYFLPSAAEGFKIVKSVGHPQVLFLYDLFHEQMGEGNLIQKLRDNCKYIGTIHVADVPGRHQPGTGEINYQNIFRVLAELRYDRRVAMEFLPIEDAVAELSASRELANQFGCQHSPKS
jgi:hydroxypyruvate isomerase